MLEIANRANGCWLMSVGLWSFYLANYVDQILPIIDHLPTPVYIG